MIGKAIAAYLGSRYDRQDGRGGIKGAVIGAAMPGLIRRTGKLGILIGGAYLAKKAYDGARAARDSRKA